MSVGEELAAFLICMMALLNLQCMLNYRYIVTMFHPFNLFITYLLMRQ